MLSASPLIAGSSVFAGSLASLLHAAPLEEKHFLGWFEKLQESDSVISTPDQALNVMDFEPAARKALPPAHFGYLATGVDNDGRHDVALLLMWVNKRGVCSPDCD